MVGFGAWRGRGDKKNFPEDVPILLLERIYDPQNMGPACFEPGIYLWRNQKLYTRRLFGVVSLQTILDVIPFIIYGGVKIYVKKSAHFHIIFTYDLHTWCINIVQPNMDA